MKLCAVSAKALETLKCLQKILFDMSIKDMKRLTAIYSHNNMKTD